MELRCGGVAGGLISSPHAEVGCASKFRPRAALLYVERDAVFSRQHGMVCSAKPRVVSRGGLRCYDCAKLAVVPSARALPSPFPPSTDAGCLCWRIPPRAVEGGTAGHEHGDTEKQWCGPHGDFHSCFKSSSKLRAIASLVKCELTISRPQRPSLAACAGSRSNFSRASASELASP